MLSLPSDALNAFINGQLVVRETNGSFNGIPSDISAEHNIKAMNGPGGVKNVTRRLSSLIRWGLNQNLSGEWSEKLKTVRTKQDDQDNVKEHKDTKSTKSFVMIMMYMPLLDTSQEICTTHLAGTMKTLMIWST